MGIAEKVREEVKALGLTTLFFATWFAVLMFLKWLVLTEYDIGFFDFSLALIGALIVAKVVLILDSVPLERWMRNRSALAHVAVRTSLYGLGILIVLLLEKAFEARHEYGGFVPALIQIPRHQDISHVVAAAIGVTAALLIFNVLFVIRRYIGAGELLRIFVSPLPEKGEEKQA
jgi:hypothetical protein